MPLPGDPDWVAALPSMDTTATKKPTRGLVRAGLSSGVDDLQSLLGSSVQGAGKLFGLPSVESYGRDVNMHNQLESQQNGRPDLDIAPWKTGGAPVLPWLGYQAAKQAPLIATYLAGGKAYSKLGGAVPEALEQFGTMVPRALGGGGVTPGASFAVRRAAIEGGAREAGKDFATQLTGGSIAGLPIAFGSMVQEADQKPGGLTIADTKKAALLSPLYSALDAIEPAGLKGLFARGQAGNIFRRVATASFAGAAAEVPQEGLQTAMEQYFRPDLSFKDKVSNIVDAAVTGGAVGGVFGAAGGIRAMKRANPASIADTDMTSAIDEVLGLPSPQAFTDSAGRTVVGSGGADELRATPFDPTQATQSTAQGAAPTLFGPDAVADRGTIPGSTIVVGRRGDQGRFTSEATGVEQPPVVPDDTSRSFRNFTDPELISAANALANKGEAHGLTPEQKLTAQAMSEEITFRRDQNRNGISTINDVPTDPSRSGAALAEPSAGDGGTDSSAPAPASQPWNVERDTLLKGVSTRKSYSDANDRTELETVLRARLEAGSAAKGDFKLAERLGIDTNAPAAPVETAEPSPSNAAQPQAPVAVGEAYSPPNSTGVLVGDPHLGNGYVPRGTNPTDGLFSAGAAETDRGVPFKPTAPAAPASSEGGDQSDFKAQWKADVQKMGQKDPGARSIKPSDENDARTQLYQALGKEGDVGDGLEKLAQHYGILDENKRLTPLAVEIAKKDPIAPQVAKKVAVAQGFKGTAATMFNRGVQAQLGGEQFTKFADTQAGAAYAAGAQWAQEHNSVPRGALTKYEPKAYVGEVTDQQVNAANGLQPQPRVVPAEQKRQALLNRQLDSMVERGDLTSDEAVPIKRLVAQGAVSVDDAIRYTRSGRGALLTESRPSAPFRPVIAERGGTAERAISRARTQQAHIRIEQEITGQKQLRESEEAIARHKSREAIKARLQQLSDEVDEEAATAAGNPSELNVDKEGRLSPYRFENGGWATTPADHLDAAQTLNRLLDTDMSSKSLMSVLSSLSTPVGVMARRFAKFVPNFQVHIVSREEMNQLMPDAGTQGYFDHELNHMVLAADLPHVSVLLHEAIHSVIDNHIFHKTRIGRELNSIYKRFKRFGPKGDYAFTDAYEFMAEFLSRQQVRDYVQKFNDQGKVGNIFQRTWAAIRKAFGMPSQTSVEHILELAEAAGRNLINDRGRPMPSPMIFNERTQDVASKISKVIPIETASNATRRTVFGWNTIGHLVAHYAKQFPQLQLYAKAHLERRATQARWAQLFETPYQTYEQLERTLPKVAETIRYLMSMTQYQIDPTKPWDKHEHLHGAANEARLKELTDDANRKYNALRGKGHAQVYDDFRAINEATHLSMMSVSLYNLVASDPVLKQGVEGFDLDPTDAFRERAALHESPINAQRYWSDMLDNQVKRAGEYITQLRGAATGTPSEQKLQSMRLEPIEMRIKSIRESLNAMRDAPYFHLGRHGEHFVSFTLRTGSDKNVDPSAIEHAGKMISAAGFKNIEISRDSTKPNVFIRVETVEARHELERVVHQLQKSGWLKPDSEIKAAPRTDASNTGTTDAAPAWLNAFIETLQASPMFDPTDNMTDDEKAQLAAKKAQMVSHARELWLDMLPDTAIAKVMVHRNSVPGFDKDMVRNFAFRFQVGVNSLANLSASAKLTNAFTEMRAKVFDAQVVGDPDHGNVDLLQSLLSETLVREAQRPLRGNASWIDTFRALNHAFFLGFSPSYVMVNTTQLGVLLWPELAKKHGFAKSAKAIAGVTNIAFNIMRETLAAGARVGPKRALDAVITEDVLNRADGVDEGTAAFLMKIIADGVIDIGGSSRELGRVADGSVSAHLDTGLRWAAAFGLYSETFTRLVAALAARKLNGDDTAYAHQVIEQSMLNYADWNTARQMGKLGFAGPLTKVMTAFMQYNAQVMEKLYREFHTAISKGSSATEKTEARRFLAGHAVAVTTLAGTLGLPFASVAAWAVEKLVDLFDDDDEPFDATASWRNYLASIFGKDIGEIVSRGAPRAVGFDLSQRAGEQSLMPFTQYLTDKRSWREASTEMALRSYGAPFSMLLNIASGGEKIASGDLLGGMAAAAPMSLKGPVQAYRMTEQGYVDTDGHKLPMTPGSGAILAQLMGLTPQAKAEYSEARSDQAARASVLVGRAKVLRDNIIDAVESGDDETARNLIAQAQQFDAANPKFAVLPDIAPGLKRRARMQALSAATNTPIGVSPKDPGGLGLTNYANVEYRAQ